jgi:hypothetical protein
LNPTLFRSSTRTPCGGFMSEVNTAQRVID